jgi:nitroreductase
VDLDAFDALVRARRTSLVVDPDRPVPDALVDRLVTLATWAPNHKRTWPWRFAAFTGEGRSKLGEAFAADQAAAGVTDDAKLAKTRGKYRRAPLVLVVGADAHEQTELHDENRDAVCAGVQNLLLGATAAGLASFWSSPPVRTSPSVLALAGWPPGTRIVACVYLGWPTGECAVPARPAPVVTRIG